jgi:uncharacterized protein (TIGR00297 family)
MIFLYFIFFYILGIVLWITKKYDLITIAIIFSVFAIFLYFGNILISIYLLIFFSSAEIITKILDKKHEKRDYKNVLGNCLASVIFISIGQVVAAVSAINAAFSDTFSSEIGRLSHKKPVLITSFKKVKTGVDGGISFLGIFSAIFISLATIFYFLLVPNLFGLETTFVFKDILVIGVIGVLGSLIDSLIGAAIERKGLIDNCQTNFLATLISGFIAIIIIGLI